jgi:hypothetical protein
LSSPKKFPAFELAKLDAEFVSAEGRTPARTKGLINRPPTNNG